MIGSDARLVLQFQLHVYDVTRANKYIRSTAPRKRPDHSTTRPHGTALVGHSNARPVGPILLPQFAFPLRAARAFSLSRSMAEVSIGLALNARCNPASTRKVENRYQPRSTNT